jgi:potassium-transporting ATPase potassium-binding subunit
MNTQSWIQFALYFVVLLALVKPLGAFMARVYTGENRWSQKALGWLERGLYRIGGINAAEEMRWSRYAMAYLIFHVIGIVVVYAMQRVQQWLPLNPLGLGAVSPDSSFNTAISFATNTNWQGYGGESTMSYLTQMTALAVQNFLSPAAGLVPVVALIRGLVRKQADTVGNFYVDMVRSTLYVLLPMALVFAVVLVWQGVPQTFAPSAKATLLAPVSADVPVTDGNGQPVNGPDGKPKTESKSFTEQEIAVGPVASQIAIKQLGTNGGGYYNVNSAHPLENPTPLSNFLEMLAILLIPGALCYTYGKMVGNTKQGWALLAAMLVILLPLAVICAQSEYAGNPAFAQLGVDQTTTALQPGGNMEGKELRLGVVNSTIWASVTTAASNGSVNSMHDSFTPIGGLIPMFLIQLGEVVFGGVGSGLYGMLMFAIIGVFIAGLLVGRTPEYLGKKIESFEVKMASVAILIPPMLVLIGTAVAVMVDPGKAGIANPGAHGFSEILYAFTSAGNNNGSAFGGLSANTPFYNLMLGVAMFVARFWLAIPVLAIAGSLAKKKLVPAGPGTLPTDTPLFVALLVGTVLLVGALTFVPALVLGPVVEHLQMIGVGQ